MKTTSSTYPAALSVAVIGGGIAGLTCARTLTAHSAQRLAVQVQVFDEGREPGGRTATLQPEGYQFDAGAQYFTVTDSRFQQAVDAWRTEGLVAEWNGRLCVLEHGRMSAPEKKTRYIGVPTMNAVAQYLARSCRILPETQVTSVRREGKQWWLSANGGKELGRYDMAVVAVPAPQAMALLGEAPGLAAQVAAVRIKGCWAVLLAFAQPLRLLFDGAFVRNSTLTWIARNNSKPARGDAECWVLHGAPDWSEAHLNAAPEPVIASLTDAFRRATMCHCVTPIFAEAYRWRYALPTTLLQDVCLFDPALAIGVCGDWCGGPRVEGAFVSGLALAERILAQVNLR